jgi:RND family efflux transporter MFP subunit
MTQVKTGNSMNKRFLQSNPSGGTEGLLRERRLLRQLQRSRIIKIFRSLAVGMAGTLMVALSGCAPHSGQPQQGQMPPPAVTVAPVEQQEIVEWDEFTGRTAAIENVEVRPRVSGHIEAVKFQSGQLVKKGDPLFQIDARWHQAELDRRNAEYEQAKVRLENAEREAKRTAHLLESKAISIEEAEQRQSRAQEARAGLLAAEAARNAAKLDLEYTTIRSPIDGRVSRALVTEGNYVSGVAGMTTIMTTIVSVNPIHVYADVDENSLLKFNRLVRAKKINSTADGKISVEIGLGDEEGFPHRGYIESFDNKVDASAGSILLRAIVPNEEGRIIPGLFARLRIPGSAKYPAMIIEERAIGTDQAQKFVLRLTPTNTVEYRAVTLGPIVNGKRVVRDGLQPGDRIVVNGLAKVRPGMPVQPQQAQAGATNGITTAQR